MSAPHVCERCGCEFHKKADHDVHPCTEVVGGKKSRAIHALADPAQRHLDEKF